MSCGGGGGWGGGWGVGGGGWGGVGGGVGGGGGSRMVIQDIRNKPKFPMSCISSTTVRLQNQPWYKTGLVSRQVLHLLSKLQNWIWPKTGQYKTCLVSNTTNTNIEASIRATKPKPWQSHLTSETVEISIQNEKAGLMPMRSQLLIIRGLHISLIYLSLIEQCQRLLTL